MNALLKNVIAGAACTRCYVHFENKQLQAFSDLDLGKVSNKQRLSQRCTNSGHQVAVATKCFTLAPNVCGYSVWNL